MSTNEPASVPYDDATDATSPAFPAAFYKLDQLEEVALFDGISARFITGARAMFSFVRLAPGKTVPFHQHPHEQLGHVIEGSMLLTIGDDERELRPGDAYAIPGGVQHCATGGSDGCLALDVFAPPREEYLARLSRRSR